MIEAIGVDLVAKRVALLLPRTQRRVGRGCHVVVPVKIGVGTDADMIDVIEDIADAGRLGLADDHAHRSDAHHAALFRHGQNRCVGLDARVVDDGAAVAVRDRDRLR